MIGNPKTIGAKRWGSGVLVGAVSALVMAVPFAGVANAAASSVTVTPSSQNQPAGGAGATYSVSAPGAVQIAYTVLSDPNGAVTNSSTTAAFPNAVNCASNTSCTIPSAGATHPGTATVRIFDDANSNGVFDNGEQFQDVTVTFSGVPFSVTLSPDTPTTPVGNCQKYTINATDSGGRPAAGRVINIDVHVTNPSSGFTGNITFCDPGNTNTVAGGAGGAGNTDLTGSVTTDSSTTGNKTPGQAIFGISSDTPATASVTVTSADTPAATDTSTQTFTAGGANAVNSLTPTPGQASGYTGTTVTFQVTAKDAAGNPLSGVTIAYGLTGGPDAAAYPTDGSHTCGPTDNNGQTPASGAGSCTVTNGGTAGTDAVEFWVNQTSGAGPHTGGPDSGEPTTTASAVFSAPPTFTSFTVSCATPGDTNPPTNNCTVPTDQTSITFSATVKNGTTPVQGAIVTWTTGGTATSSPATGTSTTDANGVATFTVTTTSPQAGQTVTASAKIGNTNASNNPATATYAARTATTFTLSPPLETVTNGGTPAFVAKVVDQFGAGVSGQSISFSVSGRNAGKTGTVTTGSGGTAAISYTDTGVNPAQTSDTVTATDTTTPGISGNPQTSTVDYITGSTTASTIAVDVSGNGNGTTCPATSNSSTTKSSALGASNNVCAIVKNSDGQVLAGKTVTITVDKGTITAVGNGGTISTDGTSATEDTNSNGIVTATVTSNNSGDQKITFTADSTSASGTVTYAAPTAQEARNVSIAPTKPSIAPGSSQVFTATVIDEFGNPVPGVLVNFTKTGPGTFNGASSASATTNAQGNASVTLTTTSGDSGSGTVTADITDNSPFTFNNCGMAAGQNDFGPDANAKTAGNCTATSNYTVATAPPPPPSAGSLPATRSGSSNFFRGSLTTGVGNSSFGFGNKGDTPLWGDWDGDGTPSIGVYRPSNRTFYLANNNNTAVAIQVTIGNAGDLPAAGDFNGDGTDSIALFRPSTGTWYITNNDHSVAQSLRYGSNGDRPIVGDWTGQGVSKVGVYRPSTGQFFRIGHAGIRFGNVGDTPIVGDWDGNGTTTIGVVRGATWFVSNNNASAATSFTFGATGDRPFTWSNSVSPAAPTSS